MSFPGAGYLGLAEKISIMLQTWFCLTFFNCGANKLNWHVMCFRDGRYSMADPPASQRREEGEQGQRAPAAGPAGGAPDLEGAFSEAGGAAVAGA
jgi:hypothetical protein